MDKVSKHSQSAGKMKKESQQTDGTTAKKEPLTEDVIAQWIKLWYRSNREALEDMLSRYDGIVNVKNKVSFTGKLS